MRVIFHIDLNAFFASAETAMNPDLEGKPLVIAHDSRRSIVATASYEARKYGIHSAMPLYQARENCSSLIVVEPHFDMYRDLSNKFFGIISTYSQELEVASIDECYVDMTEYIIKNKILPEKLALDIQENVYDTLRLKCSIGISPNKFMAKMASDMKKPMGITIINNSNYKEILWPIPIEDMFGVGEKTAPKLKKIGIYTIGDLAKSENYDLIKPIFGKNALLFYQKANGKDYSKINKEHNHLKSVGNSTTFEHDSNDIDFIKTKFKALSMEVSERAIKRNYVSNSISIILKYDRTHSITRSMLYDSYFNDFETIYSLALLLFEQNYHNESLRLVGVSLNNVVEKKEMFEQLSLFTSYEEEKEDDIDKTIRELNEQANGKYRFMKASSLIDDEDEELQNKYK